MLPGWRNTPTDENDPFKKFLDETFKVDIQMNNTAEFDNEILTRFATGDPPDMISFDGNALGESSLRQLYDEGLLVEDWYAYKAKLPAWMEYMNDDAERYLTVDGKLTAPPQPLILRSGASKSARTG